MNRLIFATGTWQIILAASALRQENNDGSARDYLVLSAPQVSIQMKQIMMQIASDVWDWQKIIWADDILHSSLPVFTVDNFEPFLQSFRERITAENLSEIWMCKLADKAEKIVAESYPDAAIAIYEDGLHSYVPQEDCRLLDASLISHPKKFVQKFSRRVKEAQINFSCLNKYGLSHQHIIRIEKAYCFNSDRLTLPRYLQSHLRQINQQSIINTLDLIKLPLAPLSPIPQGQNYFLILGQCFSRWDSISWSEEFDVYSQMFATVAELDLVPIWKEHPRADRPFFPQLANKYANIKPLELNIHYAWPIELFARELDLQGCVSITSTSLFNLRSLFGISTYTIADELSDFFTGDFAYMTKLVAENIPSLSSINLPQNASLIQSITD